MPYLIIYHRLFMSATSLKVKEVSLLVNSRDDGASMTTTTRSYFIHVNEYVMRISRSYVYTCHTSTIRNGAV